MCSNRLFHHPQRRSDKEILRIGLRSEGDGKRPYPEDKENGYEEKDELNYQSSKHCVDFYVSIDNDRIRDIRQCARCHLGVGRQQVVSAINEIMLHSKLNCFDARR